MAAVEEGTSIRCGPFKTDAACGTLVPNLWDDDGKLYSPTRYNKWSGNAIIGNWFKMLGVEGFWTFCLTVVSENDEGVPCIMRPDGVEFNYENENHLSDFFCENQHLPLFAHAYHGLIDPTVNMNLRDQDAKFFQTQGRRLSTMMACLRPHLVNAATPVSSTKTLILPPGVTLLPTAFEDLPKKLTTHPFSLMFTVWYIHKHFQSSNLTTEIHLMKTFEKNLALTPDLFTLLASLILLQHALHALNDETEDEAVRKAHDKRASVQSLRMITVSTSLIADPDGAHRVVRPAHALRHGLACRRAQLHQRHLQGAESALSALSPRHHGHQP